MLGTRYSILFLSFLLFSVVTSSHLETVSRSRILVNEESCRLYCQCISLLKTYPDEESAEFAKCVRLCSSRKSITGHIDCLPNPPPGPSCNIEEPVKSKDKRIILSISGGTSKTTKVVTIKLSLTYCKTSIPNFRAALMELRTSIKRKLKKDRKFIKVGKIKKIVETEGNRLRFLTVVVRKAIILVQP